MVDFDKLAGLLRKMSQTFSTNNSFPRLDNTFVATMIDSDEANVCRTRLRISGDKLMLLSFQAYEQLSPHLILLEK